MNTYPNTQFKCPREHIIDPFSNQLPTDEDIKEYNLCLCSMCKKWFSLKEKRKKIKIEEFYSAISGKDY